MAHLPQTQSTGFSDEIDDAVLQELYAWVDQIPLSRPKKNLTRDFSDGVLVAEVIAHYFPKLVEIHNYPPATGTKLKIENWLVLNRKVFKKLHFELAEDVIRQMVHCKPFVIERVLLMLRTKIDTILWEKQKGKQSDQPEADQYKGAFVTSKPHVIKNINDISKVLLDYDIDKEPSPRKPAKSNKPPAGVGHVGGSKGNRGPPMRTTFNGVGDVNRQFNGQHDALLPTEMVPRIQLVEKEQECLAKEETIQILQAKVRRLEHLLHLKDIRIEDLQSKVDGTRPTGKR